MTEKIDWYKEVLELEPHSRLFFPLARMLTEAGRASEALEYLKTGIERHPEFLEARLFYVELLHRAGDHEECARQVALVEKPLSGYAGFWEAWGVAHSGSSGNELGWALAFLAAIFGHKPVTLQAVMERGLATFMQECSHTPPVAMPYTSVPAVTYSTIPSDSLPATDTEKAPAAVSTALSDLPHTSSVVSPAATEFAAMAAAVRAELAISVPEAVKQTAEEVSLRTSSMADVLAEQGDLRGALDIYEELKKNATTPETFMELQQRIDAVNARLTEAEPMSHSAQEMPQLSSKDKLICMLEALAERVEARVHE